MGLDIFGFLHQLIIGTWGMPQWVYNVTAGAVKAQFALIFILLNVLVLIWMERKVAGRIQQRMGPMRLGWHGTLQTLADVLKLISKEDVIPEGADRRVFTLAPIVAFAPTLAVYAVIPFGPTIIARDLNIALVFIASISSMMVISILMSGWSSNNKWSLLGSMRSAAQLVSYEIPLVLSVVGVAMLAGTLSLQQIVHAQQSGTWYIVLQPIGFIVFCIASLAELNRKPFDLPEAESELVAGYQTEYSGMRWAIFMLSEYAAVVSSAAIAATLYLGGWIGPSFLPPVVWFIAKVYLFIFIAMWIGWTFPRIRVDHLTDVAWKGLVPLAIFNLIVTGIIVISR